MKFLKLLLSIFFKKSEKKTIKKPKPRPKYKFSQRSKNNLIGVHPYLVELCYEVIKEKDFAVTEGLRSLARQKILVAEGKSWTLRSKHRIGHAVDIMPFVNGKGSWQHKHFFPVIDVFIRHMRNAKYKCRFRWGGAFDVKDLVEWSKIYTIQEVSEKIHQGYLDRKRKQKHRPTIDLPHIEIYKISKWDT